MRYNLLPLFLLTPLCSGADEMPPWKTNTPIVAVQREVYRKSPKPGAAALVRVEYVGPKLERMEWHGVEVVDDVWDENQSRWSTDNGRTWTPFVKQAPSTMVKYRDIPVWEGGVAREHDPASGLLVELWLRQIARDGKYHCFTYVRTSSDLGRTWSKPVQLRYEDGDAFDPANPLKPEFLQKNQAYPGNSIAFRKDCALLVMMAHSNAEGDDNASRAWRLGAVPFVGQWDAKEKTYRWTAGKRMKISADVSSRGLMEPDCAELADGRVLTVFRGSNTAKTPGRKFFTVSADGGLTCGAVQEWKYDDGSSFYSPSSIHRLVRHAKTRKLYWIGNVCLTPPSGNSPRYPLVIAEVDEKIPALKKKTVTVIDDRRPEHTAAVQFSNFSLLEDRETHAFVLYLSTYGQEAKSVYTADCWRYTLTFPK